MSKRLFGIILILWFSGSLAQEKSAKKQCDVVDLTNDCRIFDSMPAIIHFDDGTEFPNPRKKPLAETPSLASPFGGTMDPARNQFIEEAQQVVFNSKIKLASVLNSEKNLSEEFKMGLLVDPSYSLSNLARNPQGEFKLLNPNGAGQEVNLNLYWPPKGAGSKLQWVPSSQILNFLNSKSISKRLKDTLAEFLLANTKLNMLYTRQNPNTENEEAARLKLRKEKVRQLAEISKRAFEKVFSQNVTAAESVDLQNTIASLPIKFQDEFKDDFSQSSCGNGPNAFYHPGLHVFVICNSIVNYPDSQLVGVIGHELGHALNACSMSVGLDKIDRNILQSFIEKPSNSANSADRSLLKDISNNLSESNFVRINNDNYLSPAFLEAAEKAKLFTKIVPRMEKEDYVFNRVEECLVKQGGFRTTDDSDTKNVLEGMENVFAKKAMLLKETDRQELRKRVERSSSCLEGIGKKTELDEASSDMWGALAIEEYLIDNPVKTDQDKLSLHAFFSAGFCSNHQETTSFPKVLGPQHLSLQTLKQLAEKSYFEKQEKLEREHPENDRRLNQIYFSLPAIANSLGCQPSKSAECFNYIKNYSNYLPAKNKNQNNSNTLQQEAVTK